MIPVRMYEQAVVRVATYIRSSENQARSGTADCLDAFQASTVLAIAFGKDPEAVVMDIVKVRA